VFTQRWEKQTTAVPCKVYVLKMGVFSPGDFSTRGWYPLFEAAQLNLAREDVLVGLLLDRLLAAPPHSVAPRRAPAF
jgi:hypothetical protein